MLECGCNYKGSQKDICSTCNVKDDENHRLNNCFKFRGTNNFDRNDKVDFNDVYSNDLNTLTNVISAIERVWNTQTAHGTIRN